MRHFFILAEMRKDVGGTLDEVNGYYEKSTHLASLSAPYRHARLSAVRLAGNTDALIGFKEDATIDELREELGRREAAMRMRGLLILRHYRRRSVK
jgi:hypothetical protein